MLLPIFLLLKNMLYEKYLFAPRFAIFFHTKRGAGKDKITIPWFDGNHS